MTQNKELTPKYFKEYRDKLGFTSQQKTKDFLSARDIVPRVDFVYVKKMNDRLLEIIEKINAVVVEETKIDNIDAFNEESIQHAYELMKDNRIFSKLTNLGRRPESVYFSWMRGYVIANFFIKAISEIFDIEINQVSLIGDDDLKKVETFKKTPRADLKVELPNNKKIRIEVQSGFQGVNDIKQHKVLEAKRVKDERNEETMVMHFDIYNGQVAFVNIGDIKDDDIHWITRQQMEGQTVFEIDQNSFQWKLMETPPKFNELDI